MLILSGKEISITSQVAKSRNKTNYTEYLHTPMYKLRCTHNILSGDLNYYLLIIIKPLDMNFYSFYHAIHVTGFEFLFYKRIWRQCTYL